jgi:hypothetical protein
LVLPDPVERRRCRSCSNLNWHVRVEILNRSRRRPESFSLMGKTKTLTLRQAPGAIAKIVREVFYCGPTYWSDQAMAAANQIGAFKCRLTSWPEFSRTNTLRLGAAVKNVAFKIFDASRVGPIKRHTSKPAENKRIHIMITARFNHTDCRPHGVPDEHHFLKLDPS